MAADFVGAGGAVLGVKLAEEERGTASRLGGELAVDFFFAGAGGASHGAEVGEWSVGALG